MMNERDFCFWLNGFVELTAGQTPSVAQWKAIKEHLDLVFTKVTPPVGETKIKINVDATDAQKTVEDLKKAYDEMTKKAKEFNFPDWRWDPTHQPYWLQPGQFPPGTVICSNKAEPNGDGPAFIC